MYFPAGTTIAQKRERCRPKVYRYRYPSADVALGPSRQRAVFAVLVSQVGRAVTRDELVDAVWGDSAPAVFVEANGKEWTWSARADRLEDPSAAERTAGSRGESRGLTTGRQCKGRTVTPEHAWAGVSGGGPAAAGAVPEMWKTGHSLIKARMKETGAQGVKGRPREETRWKESPPSPGRASFEAPHTSPS